MPSLLLMLFGWTYQVLCWPQLRKYDAIQPIHFDGLVPVGCGKPAEDSNCDWSSPSLLLRAVVWLDVPLVVPSWPQQRKYDAIQIHSFDGLCPVG
jgi:hypothetical protein